MNPTGPFVFAAQQAAQVFVKSLVNASLDHAWGTGPNGQDGFWPGNAGPAHDRPTITEKRRWKKVRAYILGVCY